MFCCDAAGRFLAAVNEAAGGAEMKKPFSLRNILLTTTKSGTDDSNLASGELVLVNYAVMVLFRILYLVLLSRLAHFLTPLYFVLTFLLPLYFSLLTHSLTHSLIRNRSQSRANILSFVFLSARFVFRSSRTFNPPSHPASSSRCIAPLLF